MKPTLWAVASIFLALFSMSACENKSSEGKPQVVNEPPATASPVLSRDQEMQFKKKVAEYWGEVRTAAKKNRQNLNVLNEVIAEFLREPSVESLDEAKKLWLEAYVQYQSLSVISRFSEVAPNVFAEQENIWLAIDPYPIAIGFVDEFGPYKNVGIVNDLNVEMNEASIRSQHAITDESEAVLGFMPMAFLLWGDKKTSEERLKDFSRDSELKSTQRRRKLLELNSLAIAKDSTVLEQWLNDTGPIDVLFYRLPVIAQAELIRQSTAALIESRILPPLNDVLNEDWRPDDVWPTVLAAQLRQLQKHFDFLNSTGFSLPAIPGGVESFNVDQKSPEALSSEELSSEQRSRLAADLKIVLDSIRTEKH